MIRPAPRSWISPFVAINYAAVGITGLLMMFHLKLPLVHPLHQWSGILFIIGGTLHLLLNWQVFTSYFKHNKAVSATILAVTTLVIITLIAPTSRHETRYHGTLESSNHR